MTLINRFLVLLFTAASICQAGAVEIEEDALVIEMTDGWCTQDPNCYNRYHHAVPMSVRARPGQMIVMETRNTLDFNLDPGANDDDPRRNMEFGSTVHPITGPVFIEGAKAGDILAVTILEVRPGPWGLTVITPGGLISDLFPPGRYEVNWKLGPEWATSDSLPGIRIPNAGFPGIVSVLPNEELTLEALAREQALSDAGGSVSLPQPVNASPADLCGADGSKPDECLRTFPPREHGGNLDIRQLGAGVTIYMRCQLDGCGLGLGDVHYAQGDGEVAGTAIEMDSTVIVRTEIVEDFALGNTTHFEGPSSLLDIPSGRFYATVGLPLKEAGFVPPRMNYLESDKVSGLTNLSNDLSLASRNALKEMLNYLVEERGLTRENAYVVMSVAADLRIGNVVDAPNVAVSVILPLDIFVEE